jgi:hypothetical protein
MNLRRIREGLEDMEDLIELRAFQLSSFSTAC